MNIKRKTQLKKDELTNVENFLKTIFSKQKQIEKRKIKEEYEKRKIAKN